MASVIKAGNATDGVQVTSDNTGILELKTGTGSGTTAVTVDTSQNVGIGTSSPQQLLDVRGRIQVSNGTNGGQLGVNAGGLAISSIGAAPVSFYYNTFANETVRIDSSGNVGIGTSSPNQRLNVAGAISSSGSLQGFITYDRATNALSNSIYSPNAGDFRIYDNVANVDRVQIDTSGNFQVVSSAKLGYGTGAGGTVTQATNKATAVTLNKPTGQITMSNSALGAAGVAVFICNNSLVTTSDVVVVTPSNNANYTAICTATTAGQFYVRVTNITAGSLSEAVVISFTVIKGAAA